MFNKKFEKNTNFYKYKLFMNLKIWTKFFNHFSVKKTILLYHDPKIIIEREKKIKIYNRNINKLYFSIVKSRKNLILDNFCTNFKKPFFLISFSFFLILKKKFKFSHFIKFKINFGAFFSRNPKNLKKFCIFPETENLMEGKILHNYNLKLIRNKIKQFRLKKKCSVNIFITHSYLIYFYFKKVFLKNLTIEKKRIKYWFPDISFKFLSEILCSVAFFSSSLKYWDNFLRFPSQAIYLNQSHQFSKNFFEKHFSIEGTIFFDYLLFLQTKKILDLEEILNKIPPKKNKVLFFQFSKLLTQQKYHKEFILQIFDNISNEKKILKNLLVVIKCFLKIQKKIKTNPISSVFYNLVMIFKENLYFLLSLDYFFQNEMKFLPLGCLSNYRNIYFSSIKKEKELKKCLTNFFFRSIKKNRYSGYLKFFLCKIISKIFKKPKIFVKGIILEIILELLKKILMNVSGITEKKYIKNLRKHRAIVLKKCNILRLFFVYRIKQAHSNKKEKKLAHLRTLENLKKEKDIKIRSSFNTNSFSFLDFNKKI